MAKFLTSKFKLVGSTVPLTNGSSSLYIIISVAGTDVRALIESGSSISILPPHYFLNCELKPPPTIVAINGSGLQAAGRATLDFSYKNYCSSFTFVCAKTVVPILGTDFLKKYKISLNFESGAVEFPFQNSKNKYEYDETNTNKNEIQIANLITETPTVNENSKTYANTQELLHEYSHLFNASNIKSDIKHNLSHNIELDSDILKPRRYSIPIAYQS